jgi:hypothetical protein
VVHGPARSRAAGGGRAAAGVSWGRVFPSASPREAGARRPNPARRASRHLCNLLEGASAPITARPTRPPLPSPSPAMQAVRPPAGGACGAPGTIQGRPRAAGRAVAATAGRRAPRAARRPAAPPRAAPEGAAAAAAAAPPAGVIAFDRDSVVSAAGGLLRSLCPPPAARCSRRRLPVLLPSPTPRTRWASPPRRPAPSPSSSCRVRPRAATRRGRVRDEQRNGACLGRGAPAPGPPLLPPPPSPPPPHPPQALATTRRTTPPPSAAPTRASRRSCGSAGGPSRCSTWSARPGSTSRAAC